MGYSGRYHAASLAAVFLALAVGILIGVGFGSDIVNGTADDLERSLASDLDRTRAQVDDLQAELDNERRLSTSLTPAVVANRLRGREIAVVALGELDDGLAADIRAALDPSGATLSQIAVVREPPDPDAAGAGGRGNASRSERLARTARRAGRALVVGSRDFARLRTALFSRYSGEPGGVDGVVLVRQRPEGLTAREADDTDQVEGGMIAGMQAGLRGRRGRSFGSLVGAESTTTDPSSIAFFADHDAASVDNVDEPSGRVSLVYALGGAEGEYGTKETADALLPDLLAPTRPRFGLGEANKG
jgi:hypothetical protein